MEKQILEIINDIKTPILIINNKKWFPISYLFEKILGRNKFQLNNNQKKQYKNYLNKFKLDFNFSNGGIQITSCIEENGLKEYFKNARIGSLDTEKRRLFNGLLKYLNMEQIDDRDIKLNVIAIDKVKNFIKDYPDYIKDIIYDVLKENNYNIEWKKCNQCGKYYPIHELFFTKNPKCADNYMTLCKDCYDSSTDIGCCDVYLHNINKNHGYDTYKKFKGYNNIEFIYDFCIKNNESFPNIIYNKENYLKIIKYLYDINIINNNQLNLHDLKNISKLEKSNNISLKDIYEYIDKDFKYNLYKYPYIRNYRLAIKNIKLNKEDIITNINNYIETFKKTDIFNENIENLIINKCNLKQYVKSNEILYYIKQIYNQEYPAYKFNYDSSSDIFWNDKGNRINELKMFIENNNIDTIKIPLYITKRELEKSNVYGILSKILDKYYSGDIFKWVDEVFPNIFKKEDFNITQYRNYFDSIEEEKIDFILRQYFTNVIYNRRNTNNTIEFNKSIPDWLIISKSCCIIVEYFGYEVYINAENKRIKRYKRKTKKKHIKYDKLSKYKKLYIYPDDLKENNKGLIEKINKIINQE